MSALDKQVDGKHYKDMAIQPVEFCFENKIPALESSVIRYVCRHRRKNGKVDLQKAIHCIEILMYMEYGDAE